MPFPSSRVEDMTAKVAGGQMLLVVYLASGHGNMENGNLMPGCKVKKWPTPKERPRLCLETCQNRLALEEEAPHHPERA
jgi:hypothetical protein